MAKINMKRIDFAGLCAAKGKNEADYDLATATTYAGKAAIYLKRLKLIASGYNGGKKVNLADTSQRKYYPWCWIEEDTEGSGGFRLSFDGSVYGFAGAFLGARHAAKTEALSDFMGRECIDLYHDTKS